jgi:SAM-dependent methyltransferase
METTQLTARLSPFTTFCEGPEDMEKGFRLFPAFYRYNYLKLLPKEKDAPVLVLSSGPGYFQQFLRDLGYTNVKGIDTNAHFVDLARQRGLESECASSFDWLPDNSGFAMIFGEQEVNHLTRDEFLRLLRLCRESLREGGRLVLNAANCSNPFIASEYPGNNLDHFLATAEGNLVQAFRHTGFVDIRPLPMHFYVLWKNPANYVAWGITSSLHLLLRVVFRLYGKTASIFTKRLIITGVRE